jgi:hypothetical protein
MSLLGRFDGPAVLADEDQGMGVEPTNDADITPDGDCSCGDCPCCGAANVLQGRRIDCPALASFNSDSKRAHAGWDGLSTHVFGWQSVLNN